jgi:hypothetical protein
MSTPPVIDISTATAHDAARYYTQLENMGIHYVIKKTLPSSILPAVSPI